MQVNGSGSPSYQPILEEVVGDSSNEKKRKRSTEVASRNLPTGNPMGYETKEKEEGLKKRKCVAGNSSNISAYGSEKLKGKEKEVEIDFQDQASNTKVCQVNYLISKSEENQADIACTFIFGNSRMNLSADALSTLRMASNYFDIMLSKFAERDQKEISFPNIDEDGFEILTKFFNFILLETVLDVSYNEKFSPENVDALINEPHIQIAEYFNLVNIISILKNKLFEQFIFLPRGKPTLEDMRWHARWEPDWDFESTVALKIKLCEEMKFTPGPGKPTPQEISNLCKTLKFFDIPTLNVKNREKILSYVGSFFEQNQLGCMLSLDEELLIADVRFIFSFLEKNKEHNPITELRLTYHAGGNNDNDDLVLKQSIGWFPRLQELNIYFDWGYEELAPAWVVQEFFGILYTIKENKIKSIDFENCPTDEIMEIVDGALEDKKNKEKLPFLEKVTRS